VVALAAATLVPAGASTARAATAAPKTITVAGLGNTAVFADGGTGAAARFQRANARNEVKGYTLDFKGVADDKTDVATAQSEAQRLVSELKVLAVVPDMSLVTPGGFLTSQGVPWFGPAYDTSYCPEQGVRGYGLSPFGCVIRTDARRLPNTVAQLVGKELAGRGVAKPSIAMIGTDSAASKQAIADAASTYTGAGLDVVYAKGAMPGVPALAADPAPYVQAMMTSDNGVPPDAIYSTVPVQSGGLALLDLVRSQGYTGLVLTPFYSSLLVSRLQGTYVFSQFAGFESDTPAMRRMLADVEAYKAGTKPSLALAGGYFSADMFIAAVQAALRTSKTLTSASVQRAASRMTYELDRTVGPVRYPDSYRYPVSACATLLVDTDGTAFTVAQRYRCSDTTYPLLPRFTGS
jgi:ABC-type branched-subunit amino acid transport system substrate-binding protein